MTKTRPSAILRIVLAIVFCVGLMPASRADEECKRIMAGQIKICAEDCQRKALAATQIKDPNNNILFLCIKKCAQDMTLQNQVCN